MDTLKRLPAGALALCMLLPSISSTQAAPGTPAAADEPPSMSI